MLTHQEIFDKSCSAIIAQGRPAMIDRVCCYAGPNNSACAVGQLLPRDIAEEWEAAGAFSVSSLRGKRPTVKNARKKLRQLNQVGVPTDRKTLDLLEEIQTAHDIHSGSAEFLAEFRRAAGRIAENYGLSPAVLT